MTQSYTAICHLEKLWCGVCMNLSIHGQDIVTGQQYYILPAALES